MSLESLDTDLQRFTARHEFGRRLKATHVVAIANECAQGRFVAISFRSGELTVTLESQAQRYLIQGEIPTILKTINQRLGQELVRRFRFRFTRTDQYRA